MTRSRREIRKILRYYRTPSFPASFMAAKKFRHALKERLGIDIGLRELEDILEKDLSYQMSKVRGKNPNKRRIVSNGVTISAQVDTAFIHLKIPRNLAAQKKNPKGSARILDYKFLATIDVMSRYIYCTSLPQKINKETLKQAFDVLLKGPQKMPRFVLQFGNFYFIFQIFDCTLDSAS